MAQLNLFGGNAPVKPLPPAPPPVERLPYDFKIRPYTVIKIDKLTTLIWHLPDVKVVKKHL